MTGELSQANKNHLELLTLRGEVGVLRRQLAEAKITTTPAATTPPKPTMSAAHRPGAYVSMSQLAFVGYATPEAALETAKWALMRGTVAQANETVTEEMRDKTITQEDREDLAKKQQMFSNIEKGFQIVAKKILADDKVELKVKDDYDPEMMKQLTPHLPPEFMVQPMVKVGDEWKLGGSTRGHTDIWDADGQIQTFTP